MPGDSNWLGSRANGGTVIALSGKLMPTATLGFKHGQRGSGAELYAHGQPSSAFRAGHAHRFGALPL